MHNEPINHAIRSLKNRVAIRSCLNYKLLLRMKNAHNKDYYSILLTTNDKTMNPTFQRKMAYGHCEK